MKIKHLKPVDNVFYIEGSFTFRDHDTFFDIISEIKSNPNSTYTINLTNCELLDSAALGMLVIAYDEATAKKCKIILQGARGKITEMLYMARFDSLFEFDDFV